MHPGQTYAPGAPGPSQPPHPGRTDASSSSLPHAPDRTFSLPRPPLSPQTAPPRMTQPLHFPGDVARCGAVARAPALVFVPPARSRQKLLMLCFGSVYQYCWKHTPVMLFRLQPAYWFHLQLVYSSSCYHTLNCSFQYCLKNPSHCSCNQCMF
jgi:hypothetical protein